MIDFSCCSNFIKPNISIDYNEVNTLKENCYKKLLSLIAKRYNLSKSKIELYNGYSSAIYSFLKYINLKHCFIYSPSEHEYRKAALNLDYEVKLINRFENIYYPIKENSVVIFMNPSFLDGTYYELEKLFEYWISKGTVILIDETYFDYCHLKSAISSIDEYKKLYIIKDFSKYFSNELLDIASIFSNEENINQIRRFEPSNKISIYNVKYLEESLKDEKFKNISNSINIKNRIELENSFFATGIVDIIYQSNTNSLLIKLKDDIDINRLKENFLKNNIKVESCEIYDFLDEKYLNIYIKSKDDIQELKKVLDAF